MDEYWMFAICAVGFVTQLALCFRCKKLLVRLLPVILPVLLGLAFFGMFFLTEGNWAWLLLAVILQNATGAAMVAWVVYGGYRLTKKFLLLSSKNT
jgi:hypothetical protein